MVAKKTKKAAKRIKNLPVKSKNVRGGAYDAFLKIDGIKGESTDSSHKDWIEILSYKR